MSNRPISSFPLSASDQIDVIELFLELTSAGNRVEYEPEVASNQPFLQRNDSIDPLFPPDPFEI